MKATKINNIEAKASAVLEEVFGELENIEPPINLSKILKEYNLTLKSGTFDDKNISGVLDRTKNAILVAEDEAPNRKAFTVAHELGHYILHKDKQTDIFLREQIRNITEEAKEDEQEANWFAASLLMPKKLVEKYFFITKDLSDLSIIFGVSPTAVRYRLKNLGLQE